MSDQMDQIYASISLLWPQDLPDPLQTTDWSLYGRTPYLRNFFILFSAAFDQCTERGFLLQRWFRLADYKLPGGTRAFYSLRVVCRKLGIPYTCRDGWYSFAWTPELAEERRRRYINGEMILSESEYSALRQSSHTPLELADSIKAWFHPAVPNMIPPRVLPPEAPKDPYWEAVLSK